MTLPQRPEGMPVTLSAESFERAEQMRTHNTGGLIVAGRPGLTKRCLACGGTWQDGTNEYHRDGCAFRPFERVDPAELSALREARPRKAIWGRPAKRRGKGSDGDETMQVEMSLAEMLMNAIANDRIWRVQFSRKHGSDPGDERRTFEDLDKVIGNRIAGAERTARANGVRELSELRALVREGINVVSGKWERNGRDYSLSTEWDAWLEKARAVLGDAPHVRNDGWIPVTERMPPSRENVLVAFGDDTFEKASWDEHNWVDYCQSDTPLYGAENITHWRPVALPTTGQAGGGGR